MKWMAFLLTGLMASAAWGQTTQPAAATNPVLPPDQMLSQMLKPSGDDAKPLTAAVSGAQADAKSGAGAMAPGAPAQNVLREGTYLVDRTGRLTKSADGQQMEFTFDADGQAMRDPPVVILPNLKLMAMENAVTASNRDLRFRVTGMVTEYRGRNYVLLEKVVVAPDVAAQF